MTPDAKWLLDDKYEGLRNPHFEADTKRLASGEPLGYVIGWQPFLDLKIYLDSRPLIPRPETEWWTEQLLNEVTGAPECLFEDVSDRDDGRHSKFSAENYACPKTGTPARPMSFLDLCAGSGAIGCAALARLPNAQVYFGEVDPAHEATILKNICENNLDASRASVRIGDLFEPFEGMTFDIVASNPPYVPHNRVLPRSVADYEPSLALLAGEEGLDYVRRIARGLSKHLAKGGVAWVECDRGHAEAAQELFTEQGFAASIRTDQYGKPRIIVVSFP
ncbi:MAG: HemK/PrmC family methyltransferase [Candidatus Paceibacterota bacterium]|jgi:release factor glutamine methyltransferase